MLELKNICVSYVKINVLKNLSGTINDGDFIILIGTNGAGKSTFFDVISGATKPDRGTVLLDGRDITTLDELARAPFVARLFQNTHLSSVPSMTVAENLALSTYKQGKVGLKNGMKDFPDQIIEEVLKPMNLNLEQLLHKPMGSLSGGQRQIISLAMATVIPPKILLLDEPTAALDPGSATKLLIFAANFIKKHNITTILITHDPHIATTLGNKLWILENGTITRTYGLEKKELSTDHLIGEINYNELKEL
jgi:putative ABC transport system ATP-binding protein